MFILNFFNSICLHWWYPLIGILETGKRWAGGEESMSSNTDWVCIFPRCIWIHRSGLFMLIWSVKPSIIVLDYMVRKDTWIWQTWPNLCLKISMKKLCVFDWCLYDSLFRGLKEVLRLAAAFENGGQCHTGLRDQKQFTLLFHPKQLQECFILECLQFPVEWQVITSARGKHTLKYIRGITRLYCPLWKFHELQNCRFWWEGVCSYEKVLSVCSLFFLL